MNLAETIRETTKKHLLENNGLIYGQCLSAVGWVGGTVPELREEDGIVELPTSDSSNSAIVCGAALADRRPIYIIRYQGFLWYNACSLVNYAAKSKEMWGVPCPVFIRGISMEGGMGPVAGNVHHSMIARMPGIKVFAPMTPKEWLETWDYFMTHDDPVFCSEHRLSFNIDYEMVDCFDPFAKITIFAISAARLSVMQLLKHRIYYNVQPNVYHIKWLKPFSVNEEAYESLRKTGLGLVIDSDYPNGVAQSIAHELMLKTGAKVYTLGLEDRTAGFTNDNLTPSAEKISQTVLSILKEHSASS